jgi:hypothetical protein
MNCGNLFFSVEIRDDPFHREKSRSGAKWTVSSNRHQGKRARKDRREGRASRNWNLNCSCSVRYRPPQPIKAVAQ